MTIKKILFNDPILDKISSKIELPSLTKTNDIYLDLLEVIISQQLSGKVAKVIYNRFLMLFENSYPKPEILREIDDKMLRKVGLSNAKTNYVKNLANFAITNDISINSIDSLNDDEIIELLTKIKGVGKWSVEMILIFSLLRTDIFPYDDLVIKKSIIDVYGIKKEGNQLIEKMISISDKWKPNRSLASRYLWANYDLKIREKEIG
ncbi:MAG: DNA-3-methyladenine glycosylase 2 family protein [Bacteroidales bacterium]|nr:DNA-3-methyladenine glycosylase 2 family protein [Bacteroidales bacterium]